MLQAAYIPSLHAMNQFICCTGGKVSYLNPIVSHQNHLHFSSPQYAFAL